MIILKDREKGLELRTILKSTVTHKFRRLDMSTPTEILKVELKEIDDYETSECTQGCEDLQIDTRYHAKLNVLEGLTENELDTLITERDSEECLRELLREEIAESSSEDDMGR